jgi:hypothetical protein
MTCLLAIVLQAATLAAAPPMVARLRVDAAFVRAAPDDRAPIVGLLRSGDEVTVLGCAPRCGAADAWALLDGGAIRASLLRSKLPDGPPIVTEFGYGRVRSHGARVLAAPEEGARLLQLRPAGQDLAFLPNPALLALGWLQCVAGGYIRSDEIRLATASTFSGEHLPSLPHSFTLKSGTIRVARLHSRPADVPADAKWVHVSVRDQVLVAYEGDDPVFATLVSTGLDTHPTATGLFRVFGKERHSPMHGDPPEPYFVDEVPTSSTSAKGWRCTAPSGTTASVAARRTAA